MTGKILCIASLLVFLASSGYSAESKKTTDASVQQHRNESAETAQPPGSEPEEKLSVTRHSLHIGGKILNYTATAGYMPIRDASGKHKANMFFIAYTKDPGNEPAERRPITFAFNGGPGAASMWLHLGAIGPKRVPLTGDGPPPPPYKPVDNESTWLEFTDLVFIDPVGTGLSRPAEGESAKQFYGIKEDIESVGKLIRLYVTKYGRWMSPKFIAGESYGTLRAAGLLEHLYKTYGMDFNGVVLISMALDFQNFVFAQGNDLPYMLFLPTYAATAWYHGKLAPELQQDLHKTLEEVEKWALNEYVVALAKGSALNVEERETVVQNLSRFTGLSKMFISNSNIRIDRTEFMNELLRDRNLAVGLFDSRATGYGEAGGVLDDPGLAVTIGPYAATINNYIREDLKFESNLAYVFLSFDTNGKWDWGSAVNGYVNVADDLQDAMNRSKHLKVFVASGYFDLDTPYFGSVYTMTHLNLAPDLRNNVTMAFYDGGHQLYSDVASLRKLAEDVQKFYRASVPGQ